jgi:hypothetical protein
MQIKVIQDDGISETITLTGEWRVQEGEKLDRLIGPHGFTHFFSHTGEYDGWGSGVFEPLQHSDVMTDSLVTTHRLGGTRN